MNYRSVREILNAVFDSDDSALKTILKTDGEVLNMVLDESGAPALKVRIDGASSGISEEEKAELAKASKNFLINPFDSQFVINQREYVSGSVLSDGQYGYDRWKASGGEAVVTYYSGYYELTSGTIEQVVEAADLTGETLVLSADTGGTDVICEVDGQSGTLPFTTTVRNTGNISVKLTGGKVRNIKLGYNDIYSPINNAAETTSCQRYYEPLIKIWLYAYNPGYSASKAIGCPIRYKVSKRDIPTVNLGSVIYGKTANGITEGVTTEGFMFTGDLAGTAAGTAYIQSVGGYIESEL